MFGEQWFCKLFCCLVVHKRDLARFVVLCLIGKGSGQVCCPAEGILLGLLSCVRLKGFNCFVSDWTGPGQVCCLAEGTQPKGLLFDVWLRDLAMFMVATIRFKLASNGFAICFAVLWFTGKISQGLLSCV